MLCGTCVCKNYYLSIISDLPNYYPSINYLACEDCTCQAGEGILMLITFIYCCCLQIPEESVDHDSTAESVAVESGESNGKVSKPAPTPAPTVITDASAVDQNTGRTKKGRERPSTKSLQIHGTSYHCVNWYILHHCRYC